MKKFRLVSLGCPKNLTDSEEISSFFHLKGYRLVNEGKAQIAVINTCAFLNSAVRESRSVIEEYIDLKRKGIVKKLIVAGCLVEREKEKILKEYPQIDAVIGVSSLDMIDEVISGKSYILKHPDAIKSRSRLLLTKSHSVYLKIADGCDNRCSYCVIPYIRGPLRSKTIEDIFHEAEVLSENGAVEISLIAQDLTAYGRDVYGKPSLKELLKKLSSIRKVRWFRLMYLYPDLIDRELLEIIKDSENICHYLEMPLQHISDNVLKRMNRRSSEKSIRSKVDLIRKILPKVAIRTTFITGFPHESEKDFMKLLSFVREYKFENMAVFKYSREKGTKAWSFDGQLSPETKNERYNALLDAQAECVDDRNRHLIGKEFEILADSQFIGRRYADAPEIDGQVKTDFPMIAGKFYKAKIIEAMGYHLRGKMANQKARA